MRLVFGKPGRGGAGDLHFGTWGALCPPHGTRILPREDPACRTRQGSDPGRARRRPGPAPTANPRSSHPHRERLERTASDPPPPIPAARRVQEKPSGPRHPVRPATVIDQATLGQILVKPLQIRPFHGDIPISPGSPGIKLPDICELNHPLQGSFPGNSNAPAPPALAFAVLLLVETRPGRPRLVFTARLPLIRLPDILYPVPLEGVDTFVIAKPPPTNGRREDGEEAGCRGCGESWVRSGA
jgi:hypothetical protein